MNKPRPSFRSASVRHYAHQSLFSHFLSLEAIGVFGFLLLGAISLCWTPLASHKSANAASHADPIREIEPINERHDQFAVRYDDRCVLWNAATDELEPFWLPPGANRVTGIASYPTDQQLAVAQSDGTLTLYDVENQGVLWQQIDTTSDATTLDFSPDGAHLLYASSEGDLTIRDSGNGESLWTLRLGASPLLAACFSATGEQVFTVNHQVGIVALDVRTGEQAQKLPIRCGTPRVLRASPNGNYLAIGTFDGQVIIWNLQTETIEKRWHPSIYPIGALLFTPNQREVFTTNIIGSLARVAIDRDDAPVTFERHTDAATSLAMAGPSLVSACYRGELRIWDDEAANPIAKGATFRRSQSLWDNRDR